MFNAVITYERTTAMYKLFVIKKMSAIFYYFSVLI